MDFNAALQTWIAAVTRPGTEFFEQESTKPQANLTTALIWVVIAAVVAALFGVIAGFTNAAGMQSILGQAGIDLPMAGMTGFGALGYIIIYPIAFLIGVGILHLVATVLGGKGDFGRYAYLIATFWVPLVVVGAVIGIIPILGGCIAMLLALYQIVLAFFATKVNYRLTDGRAIAVVLTPVIIVALLAICAGIFTAMALSSFN